MNGYTRHVRAAACYRDALHTQTPARQITLLYDAVLLRVKEARLAVMEGRIEDRYNAVVKAFNILQGLQACLDFERGGEIAPILSSFYDHAMNRLLYINQTNDPAICDELIAFLSPMRASWAEIADGTPSAHPVQPPSRRDSPLVA